MGDLKSTELVFPKLPIIPSMIYHLAECKHDDYTSCTASSQLVTGTGNSQSCITTIPISLPSHNLHWLENTAVLACKNWFKCTTDTDCYILLKDSRQQ